LDLVASSFASVLPKTIKLEKELMLVPLKVGQLLQTLTGVKGLN
jgi:hypothetical protein